MRVKYQIIVEIEADGLKGPLAVLDYVRYALNNHLTVEVDLGKIRLAACYPVAQDEPKGVEPGVQASDPGRQVVEPDPARPTRL